MSTPSDQAAPPSEPVVSSNDRNLAMLTHLSGFVLYVIMPLVVWLMHKDRPEKSYLTGEAKEALNFQITMLIAWVVSGILQVILIGFLLMAIVWVANLIFCVIAAAKVSADGHYRYPFTLRLVN
ncbi:DUF4870 domain-containing protein [Dyella mobilis]|uniref:DUF4870 domain-containing protein n=1 Tax=Dyella mobilis TaxID=1849582 RepID=A0ABS2KJD4_9GAMM|nr:DUF4870 domain-containing protein [Dyella mobilis]MBM7130508.1 DUF4870 domain-containing protein [Dyella mobilis]GLQ97135.1 membrane protein [Dyella mobilis]